MNGQSNDQKQVTQTSIQQCSDVSARMPRDANEGSQLKRHAIMSAFATVMAVTAVLYSLPIHAASSAPTTLRAL